MKVEPAARRRVRRFPRSTAAAGVLAVALSAVLAAACSRPPAAGTPRAAATSLCPWLSRSLPAGQRVGLLLSRMTLPDKINMVTGAGNIPAIARLCVPAMSLQDGPNGVGDGLTGVTQLPAGVSLAATWDRSLAAEYGKVIGAEERGKGKMVNLGPTVNIDRDPRWGRSFEAYTEDPYLNASITVPVIDGVQS